MRRAIALQLFRPTWSKFFILKQFSEESTRLANSLLKQRGSKSLMRLHRETYLTSKSTTNFNSQVICDIERSIVKIKGSFVKGITVKFNIPRNCRLFETKSNFFVELGLYPRRRIAVPIKRNRNLQRFISLIGTGWGCKTFGLAPNLQIIAYLTKDNAVPRRKNVLGIDVNAKHFAISVVSPEGEVLYQTYFGKHIWIKRKKIMERRALLMSLGAHRKVDLLKNRETNFVRTNLGQVIKEIINIANRFDAEIAIEKLRRFFPKGRRFNKIVMRIPFYTFKAILEQRCFDNSIHLSVVDSWHTSKWCSHCGAVGKGHSSIYALFKCEKCGQVVNADRKASLAVAVKSLLERNNTLNPSFFQFSNRQVPVNGLLHSDEVGLAIVAVQHSNHPMESRHI